jgi:hypothetical protein
VSTLEPFRYPKLRIEVPGGRTVLTKVTLDGRMLPATRVSFDSGDVSKHDGGVVKVRLEFYADIELDADLPLAVTGIEALA